MSYLLLWLAIPLLLLPVVAPHRQLGATAAQLIMAGLGLGALRQGAGTLDPRDLRDIAGRSPHGAWFIGITAGVLITATCLAPGVRNWRRILPGAPLLAGLLCLITAGAGVAVVVGALIGVAPVVLARLIRRRRESPAALAPGQHESGAIASVLLAILAIVSAKAGPLAVAATLLGVLQWKEWSRHRRHLAIPRFPMLPAGATILLGAWLWLAITIAGSGSVTFGEFAADAPVSEAASIALAGLAIGWAIAIAAPWPLDRLADVSVQLPALGVVFYSAMHGVPDGLAHWQPLLTMAAVPAAILAVALGRWNGAAAALTLLGATRQGPAALGAALLLAGVPAGRRVLRSARLGSLAGGIAVAALIAIVLRDEVVLAVILAFGIAAGAVARDRLVAPV